MKLDEGIIPPIIVMIWCAGLLGTVLPIDMAIYLWCVFIGGTCILAIVLHYVDWKRDFFKAISEDAKRKGIDVSPEQIKLAVAIGEYLEKHPEILEKVQKK